MASPGPPPQAPPLFSTLPQGAAEGNLVDTFSRVLGVFVHYTDEQASAWGWLIGPGVAAVAAGCHCCSAVAATPEACASGGWLLVPVEAQCRSPCPRPGLHGCRRPAGGCHGEELEREDPGAQPAEPAPRPHRRAGGRSPGCAALGHGWGQAGPARLPGVCSTWVMAGARQALHGCLPSPAAQRAFASG